MKVAVLCGGRSHERAISLRSGLRADEALQQRGHTTQIIDVGPSTEQTLRGGKFDVAVIAVHGREGEDGQLQLACMRAGVPFTGSRSGPCAAAFDKGRAKRLLVGAGVPTPDFVALSEQSLEAFGSADALADARALGSQLVVKPARGGSAQGVRLVEDPRELPRAILSAMSYDRSVIVEQFVSGREVAVGITGAGDAITTMMPVHIVPRHAQWFDAASRYTHGETEFHCPPTGWTTDELAAVRATATDAYRALDLSGFGRVDMILGDDGTPAVLECAPVPGLTELSIIPIALGAEGVSLASLLSDLIDDALLRHAEESSANS